MKVLGIDPGASHTGLCVIAGLAVLEHVTIHRDIDTDVPAYVRTVVGAALDLAGRNRPDLIAVEDLVPPSWYMNGKASPMNPAVLIGAGRVLGAVESVAWDSPLVHVRPGHNGSRPFGDYPDALVTTRERARPDWRLRIAGKGKLCHARSAYDVAVFGAYDWTARQ